MTTLTAPTTIADLYAERAAGETTAAMLTDGRDILDISRNDDDTYHLWTNIGEVSNVAGERMVIAPPAQSLTTTIDAPADCTKEIKYAPETRDYDMYLDGQYIGSRPTYHEAEIELDQLVADRDFQTRIDSADMAADAAALREELVAGAPVLWDALALLEACGTSLTTAIHLDGQTTERAHATLAQRDEYLRYNPSAWIVPPVAAPSDALARIRLAKIATLAEPDDQPDDHNLTLPDPNECPSTSDPAPIEDLPTCQNCGGPHHIQRCGEVRAALLATPDGAPTDEELADEQGDPADEDVYAPVPVSRPGADDAPVDAWGNAIPEWLLEPLPETPAPDPCFILPDGQQVKAIILCIGGVSREISADLVAGALALGAVHARPQMPPTTVPTIVLTSQNPIKLRALQSTLTELNITANVIAVKAPSGVNEQPLGDETRQGAINRIAAAREQQVGDVYVSIENGLYLEHGRYVDRAIVVIEWPPSAPVVTLSDGVRFPFDAVMEAARRGLQTTTVGQVLAERGIVKDHADPHFDLCGTSRETLVRAAVRQALAQVFS